MGSSKAFGLRSAQSGLKNGSILRVQFSKFVGAQSWQRSFKTETDPQLTGGTDAEALGVWPVGAGKCRPF
jgi:hypothetical protein